MRKFQVEQMRLKDERAKICNEILSGIKVIKLYAWEPPMEEKIEQIRQKELDLVRKAGLTRAVIDAFNNASPFFVSFHFISGWQSLTESLLFQLGTVSNPRPGRFI